MRSKRDKAQESLWVGASWYSSVYEGNELTKWALVPSSRKPSEALTKLKLGSPETKKFQSPAKKKQSAENVQGEQRKYAEKDCDGHQSARSGECAR